MNSNLIGKENIIMRKIGILTFIGTINYGAQLQAFALYKILCGYDPTVEIINYKSKAIIRREHPFFIGNFLHPREVLRKTSRLHVIIPRFLRFKQFVKHEMRFGPAIKSLVEVNHIYKGIVVGSDQVWNLPCSQYDFTFYLADAGNEIIKACYAPSFGEFNPSLEDLDTIECFLNKFSHLSCREDSGTKLLNEMGLEAQTVLDPTLLLKREDWLRIESNNISHDKYVFVYVAGERDKLLEAAKIYASERSLKLFVIDCYGLKRIKNARYFQRAGIDDFIGLVAKADAVFTSSYHGFCISICLGKQVYFTLPENGDQNNFRIYDLAKRLHAENSYITNSHNVKGPINYSDVNLRLNGFRKESLDYLDKMMASIELETNSLE